MPEGIRQSQERSGLVCTLQLFFEKVRYIEILVIYQKVPTYTSIYPRLYPCSDCFQAKVFIRSKLWQTYFQSFAIVTWKNLTRCVQQVNKCQINNNNKIVKMFSDLFLSKVIIITSFSGLPFFPFLLMTLKYYCNFVLEWYALISKI